MSHVKDISVDMKSVPAIKEAAAAFGLEVREKTTYHWWGYSVGDYPLPKSFTKDDLGNCEFALGVPGDPSAYEIGVVKRRDGKEGYTFLFDFYGTHGKKLEAVIGHEGSRLENGDFKREYTAALTAQELRMKGYMVERTEDQLGNIVMRGTR